MLLILLTLFLFVILFDTLVTSKVCPILTSPSPKFSPARCPIDNMGKLNFVFLAVTKTS